MSASQFGISFRILAAGLGHVGTAANSSSSAHSGYGGQAVNKQPPAGQTVRAGEVVRLVPVKVAPACLPAVIRSREAARRAEVLPARGKVERQSDQYLIASNTVASVLSGRDNVPEGKAGAAVLSREEAR
jgi:hypothetical protein